MKITMSYPNNLRHYRKLHHLTQTEVAKEMGLKHHSLISRWEKGFSQPDLDNTLALSKLYGVCVNKLFEDVVVRLAKK
jgi:transcriptional regulator with XRE-family HTH domain